MLLTLLKIGKKELSRKQTLTLLLKKIATKKPIKQKKRVSKKLLD